jgi:excisionase family DNA binding protein
MDASYYSVKDIAGTLKVSPSTVRRLIKDETIRASRVGKRGQYRVHESEIARYLTDSAVPYSGDGLASEADIVAAPDYAASGRLKVIRGEASSGGSWQVITGDVNPALHSMPSESVNCIVTSPPYYWQRDYGVDGQIGHEDTIEGFVQALIEPFREAKRVLREDGVLFLNIGDTFYNAKGRPHGRDRKHSGRQLARKKLRAVDGPGLGLPRKSMIGIPWRVALALQEDGWTLRSDVIWKRPSAMPEPSAKDRPWRTYEHIFVFSKGPKYWFNREGLEGEEDIWEILARPDNPNSHSAPYPESLARRCIACGCPEDGTVLDPFVGSGTTMLAALRLGRSAVGIDLKEEYCDSVVERINVDFGQAVLSGNS